MALRQARAALLILLTACASVPRVDSRGAPPGDAVDARQYDVAVIEPGTVATRPVPVDKTAFRRTFQRLVREVQLNGKTPRQAALELLKEQLAQQGTSLELSGTWLAEVSRGRVLTLVPVDESSPLTPQADAALRAKYEDWCRPWGGGTAWVSSTMGPICARTTGAP